MFLYRNERLGDRALDGVPFRGEGVGGYSVRARRLTDGTRVRFSEPAPFSGRSRCHYPAGLQRGGDLDPHGGASRASALRYLWCWRSQALWGTGLHGAPWSPWNG